MGEPVKTPGDDRLQSLKASALAQDMWVTLREKEIEGLQPYLRELLRRLNAGDLRVKKESHDKVVAWNLGASSDNTLLHFWLLSDGSVKYGSTYAKAQEFTLTDLRRSLSGLEEVISKAFHR